MPPRTTIWNASQSMSQRTPGTSLSRQRKIKNKKNLKKKEGSGQHSTIQGTLSGTIEEPRGLKESREKLSGCLLQGVVSFGGGVKGGAYYGVVFFRGGVCTVGGTLRVGFDNKSSTNKALYL